VVALAARRGPASEARQLYSEVSDAPGSACAAAETSAYRRV